MGPSPKSPIRALKVVKGYMLPDPDVPNRLTIWFVGGRLSPVVEQQETKENEGGSAAYGGLNEWKELFGTEQKKTWGESFRDMGAKLLLGAELPAGMAADGTLSYQLHRPHGGHGVAYIDVSEAGLIYIFYFFVLICAIASDPIFVLGTVCCLYCFTLFDSCIAYEGPVLRRTCAYYKRE